MHLLAGDIGSVDDGGSAVDLEQSPGEIVVLSAADSELAALAAAAARRSNEAPSVRLANLMRLVHPLSVDLYVEKTLQHARLVVVRMMGGAGYWPYGLDRLRALSRGGGPKVAVIPGDGRWDAALEVCSTVPVEDCRLLWRHLVEGGATNAERFLARAAHLIGRAEAVPGPEILAHAGHYWPGEGAVSFDALQKRLDPARPVAALVFYRALLDGGSTAPIDALVAALAEEGVNALPMFVASLKDRESAALLSGTFRMVPPAIVLNTTAFAVSQIGAAHGGTVLDQPGRPVLQVVLAGSSEEAWRESARGLLPRDLTMNVVLPEVDGRVLTRAVSFKAEAGPDAATEARISAYRPLPDRVAFVARQAAAWIRLGAKPAKDRRVAIILSNYPNRDGRIANGVGLDTPESAARLVAAMGEAGYAIAGFPETSAELMAELLNPVSAHPRASGDPAREGRDLAAVATARSRDGSDAEPFEKLGPRLRGDERLGDRDAAPTLPIAAYLSFLAALPEPNRAALAPRWGEPEDDPFFVDGAFRLAVHRFGNLVVGIQPARGYHIDPKATYHDAELVPPHHYLAFYAWLRGPFGADAIVQLGKHGNLEWLPGKALGLSAACWPEVALGPMPLIYPFIVNDPGEGSQAKRRTSAVIVDHLMPAMTRAEIHGGLAELETLIDEYYLAASIDERRRARLEGEIIATAERHGLDRDLGIGRADRSGALRSLDTHLCELKEMQIRDGLHILGDAPLGRQRIDTLIAIARVPRSGGRAQDQSLHRAIVGDLGLAFDPLDCDPAGVWDGPRPEALAALSDAPWRTAGDTVERIEMLAAGLVADVVPVRAERAADRADTAVPAPLPASPTPPTSSPGVTRGPARVAPDPRDYGSGPRSSAYAEDDVSGASPVGGHRAGAVLDWIAGDLAPSLDACGGREIASVLLALDGRFVLPGPSGAPTRGRPDVLPTGRNFYSVDTRGVPTATAWTLGKAAAEALALRYFQDEGEWPRAIAMSAWGTSNMRTGGDDIAQMLALVGAEPIWEPGTGRVTGFRIVALADLGRPRIDVTLRISGMFRDAFPGQIDLIDSAIRAIAGLDEDETANPLAANARASAAKLVAAGIDPGLAGRQSASRIFGAKAGAYGTGLQVMIDEGIWEKRSDLAGAFAACSSHLYGGGQEGEAAPLMFADRLAGIDAVLHNQDNREHDILDSDDYYQFQGGLSAAVEQLKGVVPRIYHGDHSRPEKPVVRPLVEEIARVVRGRAANPKWIAGMMRHGYKGAFEMAATVDTLFAYAATTDAVADHHFDALYQAYVADSVVHDFIAEANAPALREMAARFREAIDRGLWSPRTNSAHDRLSAIISERREAAE